ncbi:MAG: DUF4145 domain-containing protein [Acidobacteriia bacterium]|nr:DUF4145 domain-containing protein [Terriglobia bacterium]
MPTDEGSSKRAGILKRVLEWVNQDRFEDHDSWMLFGNKAVIRVTGLTDGETEELCERSKPEHEQAYQMSGDLRIYVGKVLDARRTSLNLQPPKAAVRGLENSADMEPGPDWRAREDLDPAEAADYLDAAYSSELIGKLDKIAERAILLGPHEVDVSQAPDPLRGYFKEVHNCFLYGFPIAGAVLCRALLEAALKAKYEARNQGTTWKPSKDLPPEERKQSKILKLLDRAQKERILDGSRVEAAENVKDAGDAAIHRPEDFQKCWGHDDQLRRLVEDTRKVLEDLYRATQAT